MELKELNMETHTGKCLCGEVTYEVLGNPVLQGNCHCIDCRKNTGAGFATILFFKEEQVAQLSGKTSSFQYKSDSGNLKTKLFCQICGSLVLGENSGRPGIMSVYVGTLNDANFVTPQFNVYTSRALPFVKIDELLNNFEEGRQ